MRLERKPAMSVMVVTLEYDPELRFTPGGTALVTFSAKDVARMSFQQWDDERKYAQLSAYERDTGEFEGTAQKLTDLRRGWEITVYGRCDVQHFKTPHGEKVARNVFTIADWVYDGWAWKVRNRALGMADEDKVIA